MIRLRYYKKLIRIISSQTVVILLACLGAFLGSMQAAAAGRVQETEALMFSAGAWFIGVLAILMRFVKTISRKW